MAFYHISEGTTTKVPYEELVLQAWRDFPQAFSLRNHPEHPDASDIHKKLYQSLKTEGLVVSLGNKVFRLTDKGLARAAELVASLKSTDPAPTQGKSRLERSEDNFIRHALGSRSFSTWQKGERDRLVDYDARMFFQFSTSTPIEERRRRVTSAMEAIQKACAIGVSGADELEHLASFLVEEFAGLLQEV